MRGSLAVACLGLLHTVYALAPDTASLHSISSIANVASGSQEVRSPVPPIWPSTYTVSFEVSIPYLYFSQPQGLKFPVTVWYDGPNQRMRTEVLHGTDTTITTEDVEYTIYPRINETRCGVFDHGPVKAAGSSARRLLQEDVASFLPDLSSWDYGGTIDLNGAQVNLWLSQHREGSKISQYTFYTTQDGQPVKFLMAGVNWFTNGHFDEYNYDFKQFSPSIDWQAGPDNPGPFVPPSMCDLATSSRAERLTARHPVALQVHALTPRARPHTVEDAYHAFARAVHPPGLISHDSHPVLQRSHASHDLYRKRLAHFKRTVDLIKSHNADDTKSFKMRINRWADWSDDEFQALMLPKRARRLSGKPAVSPAPARRPLGVISSDTLDATLDATLDKRKKKKLPRSVDWRGTGADPGVKDQGMCGSCFAFAATGTMEGTWYVATGQRRSFSEQQVLDCSWDYGTNGCGGGDYQPVIEYVRDVGGIALEQDYPYLSNSDFCKSSNFSLVGRFKGYKEVKHRDERALMATVAKLGPVAVGVDAGPESFRYYSEGVFTDPHCSIKSQELDHAVILFGYGTTDKGEDYWLVRNTWSKFYGDDGYIKIKRGAGDCGISSDAAVAIVADEAVVPGLAEVKALEAVTQW